MLSFGSCGVSESGVSRLDSARLSMAVMERSVKVRCGLVRCVEFRQLWNVLVGRVRVSYGKFR